APPPPDLDAGGVAAPEGARAGRADLTDAIGKVAREPARGRSAARCGRLDRALPAGFGLVAHPARRPPPPGPGRRTPGQGALMDTETPQLAISRAFDAPRELVYRAFTDPD